ncbi:MAG TPA: hypothetical protein VHC22_17455 [Pirellulales bacterium]|nr:hypothetical protein [Pirellulales bacterium]
MVTSRVEIAGVADVSVGYGSPQIPRLMESLAEHYEREVVILEPDQTDKKPLDTPPRGCALERIATSVHPHTTLGRREYISATGRRINALRPDLLVLFCTYTLPVLTQLRYRPRCTVYHCIETVANYGPLDVAVNRRFASDVDLVVFPEENRAQIDGQRCGLSGLPMAVVYNASNDRAFRPSPVGERSLKLLYTGTLDLDRTLAEYFLRPELADVSIDIFGNTAGRDRDELRSRLACLSGPIRYRGYVSAATLKELRNIYAYSIIMWAPTDENQLFAAPNKFFDAIADGIPPIAAPHPQCKLIIDRYQCGILMEGWSFEAFLAAIQRAKAAFGTPAYDRMVAGCGRAVECELNWPAQFDKVKRLLPPSLI